MKQTNLKELATAIAALSSPTEVIEFLRGILTPKELLEVTQRLQIVKMLKQGKPQRQIAEELGVGVATITRGSKELQNGRFKNV